MSPGIIEALQEIDRRIIERLNDEITADSLFKILKPIADTHAPFQTAAWTRAKVIEDMLGQAFLDRQNVTYVRNFQKTGNSVLLLGNRQRQKKVWLLAHLDMITYLIEPGRDGLYPLTPICYHLMEPGERSAVVLAFDLESSSYKIVTGGLIKVDEDQAEPYFIPDKPVPLQPGMRVCFHSQMTWDRDTGIVRGSLDDAGGAAALLQAAIFLADYEIELLLALTDEEEGKAGMGSQTICRGGARLPGFFDQPELVIAADIQEAVEMYGGRGPTNMRPGDGATFAEKAALGIGEITPPHLYELYRKLAQELGEHGISLKENLGGYVSRTESINAMLKTPNVTMMGFLGKNRHFQRDVESASISDLVNLAKAVVCSALLTTTSYWQEFWKIS